MRMAQWMEAEEIEGDVGVETEPRHVGGVELIEREENAKDQYVGGGDRQEKAELVDGVQAQPSRRNEDFRAMVHLVESPERRYAMREVMGDEARKISGDDEGDDERNRAGQGERPERGYIDDGREMSG